MSGPLGSQQWMYASGGFYDHTIDNSLRFEDGDTAYLTKTPASASNRKTWTWSGWVKRGNLTRGVIFSSYFGNNGRYTYWEFDASHRFHLFIANDNGANPATYTELITSAVYRDTSAWYHIVVSVDTTQATASDRASIYINGEKVTAFSTENYPVQDINTFINNTYAHYLGILSTAVTTINFDGYIADVNFIDGQALDASYFGETKSGIWIPKDTSGLTFGTNGFRLAFGDSAAIGDDTSGNTNDFTANNLAASDVVLDSPTNNFAVLNNLDNISTTYSEGNLKITQSNYNYNSRGSFGLTSGKYYWEVRMDSTHGEFGVCENGKMPQTDPQTVYPAYFIYNNGSVGVIYNNATSTSSSSATMTNWTANDVAMIAYDADNGNLYHGLNGVWQNSADPAAGTGAIITGITTQFGGELVPFFGSGTASARNWIVNFGQDSTFAGNEIAGGNSDANGYGDFKYSVPSGFLALCSANLPQGAIDTAADETPEDYFNTVLYSGDSSASNAITGVGFQPDLVWIKERNGTFNHVLQDVIRGSGASSYKYLATDNTDAETSQTDGDGLLSLDADGFTVGFFNTGAWNETGSNYASWNWKAGGAGVSNTDGTISSTVSVGATSQQNWFSIVSYTGNNTDGETVGHGLGVVPSLVITKSRSATSLTGWMTKHKDLASNYNLALNKTDAAWNPSSNGWIGDLTSDTTFSLENGAVNGNNVNQSGVTYIAYCFANAEGLCRAGKYTGNGSTDGTFVYTGFKPAFIITKSVSQTASWYMFDNKRNGYNETEPYVIANASNTEATDLGWDILSNGFKLRNSYVNTNSSGVSYIYLAIAEQPFKYANAR